MGDFARPPGAVQAEKSVSQAPAAQFHNGLPKFHWLRLNSAANEIPRDIGPSLEDHIPGLVSEDVFPQLIHRLNLHAVELL